MFTWIQIQISSNLCVQTLTITLEWSLFSIKTQQKQFKYSLIQQSHACIDSRVSHITSFFVVVNINTFFLIHISCGFYYILVYRDKQTSISCSFPFLFFFSSFIYFASIFIIIEDFIPTTSLSLYGYSLFHFEWHFILLSVWLKRTSGLLLMYLTHKFIDVGWVWRVLEIFLAS